jgi:hypothetical protein
MNVIIKPNAYFFLLPDSLRDVNIVNVLVDLALHHGAPVVVLDVSLPSVLRHCRRLSEALFPEVLNCIIVSISQEVVQALLLSVILEFIHQPCPVPFDLL